MKQFNLSEWIQDKSRKVVTRDGRPVRIICTDAKGELPIVALVPFGNNEDAYHYNVNGVANGFQSLTLFFADEEEELTEFDYAVLSIISDHNSHKDSITEFAKRSSKKLLDLARKELEKDIEHSAVEFAKSYMEDVNPSFEKVKESEELWKWKMSCLRGLNKAYTQGKQDALKDLPKWKRDCFHNINSVFDNILYYNDYYIDINGLEKLPKEE